MLILDSQEGMKEQVKSLLCTLQLDENKIEVNTERILPHEKSFLGRKGGPKHLVLNRARVKIWSFLGPADRTVSHQ